MVIGLSAPLNAPPAQALDAATVVATTHEGRQILAQRIGPPDAPVNVVVIGQMHGDEPAGLRVVDTLVLRTPPAGVAWWLIRTANPDGRDRGARANARGVDLNRNFPQDWVRSPRGSTTWSGPRPASEQETRGLMTLLRELRPTAVLSFHQPFAVVDISQPGSAPAGRVLADALGLPVRPVPCGGPCHGTLTQWVSQALDSTAITVELGPHPDAASIRQAARAVTDLSAWLAKRV